jgi:hypothetical protein
LTSWVNRSLPTAIGSDLCAGRSEQTKAKALARFEQPAEVGAAITGELEQEFTPVAAIGDVPHEAGQEMAIGTWHERNSLERRFQHEKRPSKAPSRIEFTRTHR